MAPKEKKAIKEASKASKRKEKAKKAVESVQTINTILDEPRILGFLGKAVLGSIFIIAGFKFSYGPFFKDNPIFGIPFLAEILISLAAGLFGFHTVPIIGRKIKEWIEKFISAIVTRIVSDFWDQQSKRLTDAKRKKQKEKKKVTVQKNKEAFKDAIILDTSVLIDGRLLDICKTGFLTGILVLPQGVIDELHLVADHKNEIKRKRGRRGLDIANELKKFSNVKFFTGERELFKKEGVDAALVKIAKKYKMKLMTMDYNLNKVSKIGGVEVLNINRLVNAVKSSVIPGERIKIKIIQEGKENSQGVGYLSDGTMVVIKGAKKKVGKTISVTVEKVIQTDAGKMVFCNSK